MVVGAKPAFYLHIKRTRSRRLKRIAKIQPAHSVKIGILHLPLSASSQKCHHPLLRRPNTTSTVRILFPLSAITLLRLLPISPLTSV